MTCLVWNDLQLRQGNGWGVGPRAESDAVTELCSIAKTATHGGCTADRNEDVVLEREVCLLFGVTHSAETPVLRLVDAVLGPMIRNVVRRGCPHNSTTPLAYVRRICRRSHPSRHSRARLHHARARIQNVFPDRSLHLHLHPETRILITEPFLLLFPRRRQERTPLASLAD